MNGESKVIPFETLQSRRTARQSPNSIFALGRTIFIQGVAERLGRFFALVDDELFRLSVQADDGALQSLYFSHMRYLRCQRAAVREHYLLGLTKVYEAFWRKMPLPHFGSAQTTAPNAGLGLLESDTLEKSLAVNGMIEKGGALFRKELYALDKRFMAMLGKPESPIEVNPVSPLVLCRSFSLTIDSLLLDIKIKLLVYKLFEKEILATFGSVYHELNAQMIRAGFYPSLPQAKFTNRQRMANNGEGFDAGLDPGLDSLGLARLQLDASRVCVRTSRLSSQARKKPTTAGPTDTPCIESLLREADRLIRSGDMVLTDEQMKRLVAARRAGFYDIPGRQASYPRLEDVVGMVGMIFAGILEDPLLPAPIKALLSGLQIPVLKIAMTDPTFIAEKNHPVRILLNSLAQAGSRVGKGLELERSVYRKISLIVDQTIKGFEREPGLFYQLLEDFTTFMAIEYRSSLAAEESTRLETESKERVCQAHRPIALMDLLIAEKSTMYCV